MGIFLRHLVPAVSVLRSGHGVRGLGQEVEVEAYQMHVPEDWQCWRPRRIVLWSPANCKYFGKEKENANASSSKGILRRGECCHADVVCCLGMSRKVWENSGDEPSINT